MLEKVREIIVRYADADPSTITEDTRLAEDLGLTSFALMSMMGDFEEEFDITVDESELTDIFTVKDIMNYLESKVKQD
jgi:acyl carrier protein